MPKQLVGFPLLWSLALFLAPVPALGNIDSDCTVGDSPADDMVTSTPACSGNTAELEIVFSENDDYNIRVRIDYICSGSENEMIVGTPWTRRYFRRSSGVKSSVSVPLLHPGMNCTFYVCYKRFTRRARYVYGKATPASCVTDINECDTANGGCEQLCSNTVGSFACSCGVGYRLNENGLNCSDVDECESPDLNNCHADAQCTNSKGSFTCTCNPGYTGDGINCTNIDECELGVHTCAANAKCTDTVGSYNCVCIDGFEGNGFNCRDINECETANGGCEQICSNTVGSFVCSCGVGYGLDGNGLNCHDINECDTANGGCEQLCSNTIGSFACSCGVGYQLDENDSNCSDINECETANGGCEQLCSNTIGSFACSCGVGYGLDGNYLTCSALSPPGVGMLPLVLVSAMVVVMISAVLCGVICVLYQLRKKEKYISVPVSLCF